MNPATRRPAQLEEIKHNDEIEDPVPFDGLALGDDTNWFTILMGGIQYLMGFWNSVPKTPA